jgi:peptidoglycan/xylan/chitin deacetylase (PgdA/CDA1 family)
MTPASFARPLALVALVVLALVPAAGVGAGQAAPAAPAAPVAGTVVGSPGVNIRSCARVECSVKAVAKLGEALLVTGKQVGGFYPVDWGGLTGFAYHLYVATPETGAPELRLGAPGCKRVALIFNVGIGYETRLDVLDALKAEGVPATVFPMGWWAAQHPDLLKRIADAGFVIGNHGDQRVELTTRGDAAVLQDLQTAEAAIQAAIGAPPERFFTPYAAASDARVRGLIAGAGYVPVGWTAPADDWDFGATAEAVHETVMERVQDGAIVELHLDAPATAASTAVALPRIVAELRAAGYRFVTIPEMALPCPRG